MKYFSKALVFTLVILLFSPIWLKILPVIEVKPLSGSFIKKEYKSFNITSWFDTMYQESLEEYLLLDNYLSPFLIRLYNQIDYSLFDQIHMSQGIMGHDNYLYEIGYIESYFGRDKISDSAMESYAYRLKYVSDTLRKLNKTLLYIQCPGKASYYPEYIPDSLNSIEDKNSNYHSLVKKFNKHNIEYIDFRPYFLAQKSITKYPLFTQTGIHWSHYSQSIVMDSIITHLNDVYNYQIPNIKTEYIEEDHARNLDKDVEDVMNLLFQIDGPTYGYPKITFSDNQKKDVKLLLMSDSYLGNLYWSNFFKCFHPQSQFWFYNTQVYCGFNYNDAHILQLNYIEEVLKMDLIIVGATEPGIRSTSWGFINNLYEYFKYGNAISTNNQILLDNVEKLVEEYKKEKEINIEIKNLATKFNVSYDSAVFIKSLWDIERKNTD